MKMRFILLALILPVLALLPLASAEILIGQPENIYNIGDQLTLDVTLNPSTSINDFLTLDVSCGDSSVEIYRNSFNLNAGEQVIIDVIAILDKSVIGSLLGENCELIGRYGFDEVNTQSFEITSYIDIDLDSIGKKYDPSSGVGFSGLATRKSGPLVNGFVEARVDSLDILTTNIVSGGVFSFNFALPKESKSGEHVINIRVYEEDSFGGVSNEGLASEVIEISQVLSRLDILISSQSIFAGEEFSYKVNAYDQADDLIGEDISLTIYEPKDFVFQNKVIRSGEEIDLDLEIDNVPGYWKIEASSGGYSARKLFYVEEIEQIQTSLFNDTLVVTNTGNVRYEGPIEISIGSTTEIKQLNLKVGETKKFRLYAPDGTYLISVNDGSEDVSFGSVSLTGNAIRIEDLGGGILKGFSQPAFWLLGILLLILIIVYVQIKISKARKKHPLDSKVFLSTTLVIFQISLSFVFSVFISDLTALLTSSESKTSPSKL